ncbi:helix-turn-helix transcriptional regulator [Paraburkholderia sp. BL9I2N2]|uniref:helix-turn-helix transcriptional regulator n=1 Tax=Paraburkholderia sp. BL9I2N2 TaxID=1938809 RepID=UPI001FB516D4|nr:helix-turn-helix transcriptional regulator [Paraburkholderia sp. BL9I2N2]
MEQKIVSIERRSTAERSNATPASSADLGASTNSLLETIGKRIRQLRSQRALTRKALAELAGVSERFLAKLEGGSGNASVLFLNQLTSALGCPLSDLVTDGEEIEEHQWLAIRSLLRGKSRDELHKACTVLETHFALEQAPDRRERIALIGLRGAGKTTLGRMLADDRKCRFVELTQVVGNIAGCPVSEIYSLYGESAYRRYERRALTAVIAEFPRAVIAIPGGLVTEEEIYAILRASCFTVWLQATPDDHMSRVLAQGDMRPIAGHSEAIDDLEHLLSSRREHYAQADLAHDTSEKPLAESYLQLRERLCGASGCGSAN